MEDFLSIVVVILIAIASTAAKNKKKKKAGSAGTKGPVKFAPDADKGFSEMKEFIKDVGKTVLEMDDEEADYTSPAKMKPGKMRPAPAKAASKPVATPNVPVYKAPEVSRIPSGMSHTDNMGCIGGSIAHDSHEGESGYTYSAPDYDGDSVYAGDIAHELQAMNVNRLRRAIVISEILDRPKALRRR